MTEQRLARRARILDTARAMIAENGYQSVTVRELARRCGLSVPTLYNQFGGKDGVLRAAIEGHFQDFLNNDAIAALPAGYERVLGIVDACAEGMLGAASYHRRLLEAFASLESTAGLQQTLAQQMTGALSAELRVMQERRTIAAWVDPVLLASQMTSACIASSVVWSTGLASDAALKPSMRYATGLILLGVVRGQTQAHLQRHVEVAQSALRNAGDSSDQHAAPAAP